MEFYTARTVGTRKNNLTAFQAGGTWIYTDSPDTIRGIVRKDGGIITEVLTQAPIITFRYLAVLCKDQNNLHSYEQGYIRYVADVACTEDRAFKMLCRNHAGMLYTSYAAASKREELQEALVDLMSLLDRNHVIRVKDAALRLFGKTEGNFFWTDALFGHLAYLSLIGYTDRWTVSG